ncbi:SpaH/EbpB family LPXTG-anchored major pilin [Microbacterium maritypicum]|uniref:SpaH/EbpB family LPXTG-anchored major pilin n=1 Tax=Microbacterium maritypicum TaxID=33918 RepID=UPI001B3351F2|nr:SpaH/EbpB family LPXTG-anchored major pilin [Microbacterium liquefaciens]MBP5801136.1 SpaH/EbpB family LPXTG-anchored major pilin [Microbacterium liquefaciens]
MNNPFTRRGLRVGIAAVAAATVATLGLALPASAAPLIDPDQVGSITVHKFETPEPLGGNNGGNNGNNGNGNNGGGGNNGNALSGTGQPGDGALTDTTGLTPLPGVTFQVQQVNTIDLSTNAGWAEASALSGVFDAADAENSITGAGYTLGAGSSQVTNAAGEAAFTGLPVGLYLVQETGYPAGVTPAAPFLITVPLTDPNNQNAWLYDVHVYPKNAVTAAEKTVTDSASIQLGDIVTWTITADIPNVATIDGFKIVDPLDAKLDLMSTTVELSGGRVLLPADYTVTFDEATNTVTVEFTAAGLLKLAANSDVSVVVTLDTAVNTIGEISNQALIYPNAASFDIAPGQPGGPVVTNSPETKWGAFTIKKTDGTNTLQGAQFQVFTSAADAAAQTNPVELGGQTTFDVDAEGGLTLYGLRYSDFANNQTVAAGEAGFIQYFLVETKAPDGFELLAEPIEFAVTAATTAAGVDLEVVNVPSNAGFILPITGGTGTGLLYLVGFALITGGAIFMIVTRRRKQEA